MSTKIKWLVEWVDVRFVDGKRKDVVVGAGWRCNATSGVEVVSSYSSCKFNAPDDVFTSYENLTQDQLLEWVWKSVDKNYIESGVQERINRLIQPSIVKRQVPWLEVFAA